VFCRELYGIDITLHLLGPVGASAVLLFAVSTGALAQPWSILGSYLIAALVALLSIRLLGNTINAASLAVCSSILLMCVFRCLHPPAAAVAICIVTSKNELSPLGLHVLGPVMLNAVCLLAGALIYNNLTRVRYPKAQTRELPVPEQVPLNSEGEFVDVSREDLEEILHKTEEHALRRNRSDIDAARIVSRSTQSLSLEHSMAEAMKMLARNDSRYLPVLDEDKKVVGIITLVK
jgi:CBS domain-containing membrane protein